MIKSLIPQQIQPTSAGTVAVTFEIDPSQLDYLIRAFDSLGSLFKTLKWQAKCAGSSARVLASAPVREEYFAAYRRDVIAMFDGYISDGNTCRESLSLTVSGISKRYPNSSYDNVKKILSDAKSLRKSGFYKRNLTKISESNKSASSM